ncbi:MAG: MaoC family dehydratase N-terminal domain-containing protein [Chloroflexi bacterium]|nr:MaoC family dehydratase N-terminal domain-containing protein [Chloroflexota bacterium]
MAKELFFEDVEMGDPLPSLAFQFDPASIRALVDVWWPERGATRFDSEAEAHRDGFPRPIVPSHLSIGYLGNVVLAWAGNVRLAKLDSICRQVLFNNDHVTCQGFVVDKALQDGLPLVHADLYMESEQGERPLTSSALILVPTREGPSAHTLPGLPPPVAGAATSVGLSSVDAQGLKVDFDRSVIGVEQDLGAVTITEERIVAYARAVGASDPIYWDRRAAQHGPYGGLVALPTFCSILSTRSRGGIGPDVKLKFGTTGQEATLAVENYRLIRPGDVLRILAKVKDVYAKTGRSGTMVFTVYQDTFLDPQGTPVAAVTRSSVNF